MVNHKILIIKTGYSEILDKVTALKNVSKGDVLRTTPILHIYRGDAVTWVTDSEALPLLDKNPIISRLMAYDFMTRDQLLAEDFDTVINLEKFPPLCGLTKQINAWRKYGFRLDPYTGNAEAYDRAFEVLTVSADFDSKKTNKRLIQELLFEMVGKKWKGEEYILGYKPKTCEQFDVALNTYVGPKWPIKSWPKENWDTLEKILISKEFTVTRQDKQDRNILKNLYGYMDWLNSAKIIVTNDSLGLHLGLALNKKVLGLFGPTPHTEVYFYGRGEAIFPKANCEYFPCFESSCRIGKNCMGSIYPELVAVKVQEYA